MEFTPGCHGIGSTPYSCLLVSSASINGSGIHSYAVINQNIGRAITYIPNTTSGDRFIINEAGLYMFIMTNVSVATGATAIVCLRNNLTNTSFSVPADYYTKVLFRCGTTNTQPKASYTWCGYLYQNDYLATAQEGQSVTGGTDWQVSLCKIK